MKERSSGRAVLLASVMAHVPVPLAVTSSTSPKLAAGGNDHRRGGNRTSKHIASGIGPGLCCLA